VGNQLQRSKKLLAIRGLNHNHDLNHDLKNIFKGAATLAAATPGAFQKFYLSLSSSRSETLDGPAYAGTQDCRHHTAGLGERSSFRR
jgi:hypothetical protein